MFTFFTLLLYAIATWLGAAPLPWWLTICLLLAAIAADLIGLRSHIISPSRHYAQRTPPQPETPPDNLVTFIMPKGANTPPHG